MSLMVLKACHYGDYVAGVAAGAYCGEGQVGNKSVTFYGFGGIKNTETLYAYGLAHFIHLRKMEEDEGFVQVLIVNNGVTNFLKKYVPKWLANGGLNSEGKVPDAYDAWLEVYTLILLSKILINRPAGHYNSIFKSVGKICEEKAKIAHSRGCFSENALVEQGEL